MYKYIMLLAVVVSITTVNAQTANPSLEETQEWIANKLLEFGLDQSGTKHTYELEFKNGLLLIHSLTTTKQGPIQEEAIVPIKDIQTVFFRDYVGATWLVIRMKSDKSLKYQNTDQKETEFILSMNVYKHNMRERFIKAFNHLIELNGGKVGKQDTF